MKPKPPKREVIKEISNDGIEPLTDFMARLKSLKSEFPGYTDFKVEVGMEYGYYEGDEYAVLRIYGYKKPKSKKAV